jgi:electron transport complex protein RnfB
VNLTAILIIIFIVLLFGIIIAWVSKKYRTNEDPVIAQIDQMLPQTQCAQCGYPGCRPYAEAIAKGEANINLCPPGGEETVKNLAQLLHLEIKPLEKTQESNLTAWIEEDKCIGCVLCIKACPVDAIFGAVKQMHTVINKECTGCDLCAPVCPVDCILMLDSEALAKKTL